MEEWGAFGSWLKRRRRALDLTQAELARRVGCATITLQKIELEERRPSKEVAARLADALGLPPEERATFIKVARAELAPDRLPRERHDTIPLTGHAAETEALRRSHNLPLQPTPFIGRDHEVATLRQLLLEPRPRLVTLLGPGGAGKTRLALEVARGVLDAVTPSVPDGVWFVDLTPVSDPALVASTIAGTLGVKQSGEQSLVESLQVYLARKGLLLVLDNFEQVLAAAPLVDDLLRGAPGLKVLATSRAVLGVYGAYDYPVPPLALPGSSEVPLQELQQYAAVRLFVERAQAARPDFALTPANAGAVAGICRRLGGLPLAIELAAARVRILPPQALLERLGNALQVLTAGPRTLPARHQTQRATIDWSYNLLDGDEQLLLRRLGVFVGGWTLEAAEDICALDGDVRVDVLDTLQSLVGKSLVRDIEPVPGEARFTLLETIREYALERLAQHAEVGMLRERHACFFMALVETAERDRSRTERPVWLRRLEIEHDNLRAALTWSQAQTDGEMLLRMAGALHWYWDARGLHREGRGWIEEALRCDDARDPALPRTDVLRYARARAVYAAGQLGVVLGDYTRVQSRYEESLQLFQDIHDKEGLARVLNGLGMLAGTQRGDYRAACTFQEASARLFRELGFKPDLAWVLVAQANATRELGDYAAARPLLEESRRLYAAVGDRHGLAMTLSGLAAIAALENDLDGARSLYEESLALMRELNSQVWIAILLTDLGDVVAYQGDYPFAISLYEASLPIWDALGSQSGRAHSLRALGKLMVRQHRYGQAATIYNEALDLCPPGRDDRGRAWSLQLLGNLAIKTADHARAKLLLDQALMLFATMGDSRGVVVCQEDIAHVAVAQGLPERAVRLLGAVEALRELRAPRRRVWDGEPVDATLAAARAELPDARWQAAWAEGQAMTLEQAVAYALEDEATFP